MHCFKLHKVGVKMMNLIFGLLVLIAIFISIVIIGLLILWLKGSYSIALPGFGIILATPLFIMLLMIIEFGVVIVATFVSRPTLT